MKKKVFVVQRRLTHYRIPFFQLLKTILLERGIELNLLYGEATPEEVKKKDAAEIKWAKKIPTTYLFGTRLCWQPIYRYLSEADMVVVTQENSLLVNHLLMLFPRRFILAFWGHGANLQSRNPKGIKERYKCWSTKRADWWFAYTKLSADLVTASGFPDDRVTVLNNAVDTTALQRIANSIPAREVLKFRNKLNLGVGPIGVFIGSFYANKQLDFLFLAAEAIRKKISDFHLLLIGDGPERHKVEAWCKDQSWAQWVGVRFGREKALCLSMAHVMLNPGLVGLVILDAFACEVPILTTDCEIHSPEIAYLENWRNGVMTSYSLDDYSTTAVRILQDPELLEHLQAGCANSAAKYTINNMVRAFADGVDLALARSC